MICLMAGKSASVFPLLTTSSFMSIVGVKQTTGRGVGSWACAVCIAGEKSIKERTTTPVEIAEKRDSCFITIPPSNQRLGKLYGYVRVGRPSRGGRSLAG